MSLEWSATGSGEGSQVANLHPDSSGRRVMVLCTHPLQIHLAERGRKEAGRELGCWEFPNHSLCTGKEAFDRTSQGFVLNSNEWHAEVRICISYFSKAILMGASSQYKQQ